MFLKFTHSIKNLGHYLNLEDGIAKVFFSEMFPMHNNDCNIALSIKVAGYQWVWLQYEGRLNETELAHTIYQQYEGIQRSDR